MNLFIVFCFLIWFISLAVRVKNSKQKNGRNQPVPPVASPPPINVFETKKKVSPLAKKSTKTPKNEGFAVFEHVPIESVDKSHSSPGYQNPFVENIQQSIDNEQQNNIDLQFDTEEIEKGIIYSIILKRPEY